jgi:hypothetical protein
MRVPSPAAGKMAAILLMSVLQTAGSADCLQTPQCTLTAWQGKLAGNESRVNQTVPV